MPLRPALLTIAILVTIVVPTAAQVVDPGATARFHFGPLALTPTISISNLGQDANVFNEAVNPKRDFTAIVQPQLDAWMRAGKTAVTLSSRIDASYFKTYRDQSTVGTFSSARWELPSSRVNLTLGGSYIDARERPTPEIDTRVRRFEDGFGAAIDLRVSELMRVRTTADRVRVAFDDGASFDGVLLGPRLDRRSERYSLSLQRSLTPLTTVSTTLSAQYDYFSNDTNTDTANRQATVGMSFKPLAVLSGSFDVGVLDFAAVDRSQPGLRVPAVAADLAYTLFARTRFSVRADRIINYSIADSAGYYLQTSVMGTVGHHLNDSVSLSFSAGRQLLDYQLTVLGKNAASETNSESGGSFQRAIPLDSTIAVYDGAIAFHPPGRVRWGLHVSYMSRRSVIAPGGFTSIDNLKSFLSVTYGVSR